MSPYKSPLIEIQSVCDGRCPLCVVRDDCREESIRLAELAEVAEQDTWEDDFYPEDEDDFNDGYFDDRERAWKDDEDRVPYIERGQLDSDLGNER